MAENQTEEVVQPDASTVTEWESEAILQLRQLIRPEVEKLIQRQRLRFLTEGTHFPKYSSKGQRMKDKFWFCRLCPSQKYLHYDDCEENRIPSLDELANKMAVKDIRQLVVGRDCPHTKDLKSKKSSFTTCFSLLPFCDQDEPLNFVAATDKIFDYWTDGINALLQLEMTSKEFKNDLETLVSMDIKLRLLETEGVTIPEKAPKLPPPPPNFDFSVTTPMSEIQFFTHRV